MSSKKQETYETWNNLASLYEEKFMYLDIYNESYDFICNTIAKQNARVLDIGCGPGNIVRYLLSCKPDLKIIGTDISPNMIALAKKNNPQSEFKVMNAGEINTLPEKFDAIISGFCIPYLSEAEVKKLIEDCHNLLNENGLLYLSFVEGKPDQTGFKISSTGLRAYFYYHQEEVIKSYFILNKFQELKKFNVSFKRSDSEQEEHTVLIAKKSVLR